MEQYFATASLLKSSVPEFLSLYSKRDDGEKQMVSYINILLSTAKTRHRGLTILSESIPNLSADTLTEYGSTWVKFCITQHATDSLKEVKLAVLVKLITHAGSHHEFDKVFVGDHLSKVLEMCIESTSNHNEMEVALQCLSTCLNKYPNWFNPHVKKIEHFLLKFLDHRSEDVVKRAAEAFHNLQQSGGGGLNKINYVNNFTSSFHKLCGNVGVLLKDLSADFTEIDSSASLVVFDLTPIRKDTDYIDNYYRISQRIINCVYFLKTMLKKPFSATKIIKPKMLIDVISNVMAMHVCVCQQDVKHEDWHRSELLIKIRIHVLYLLQVLLCWLKSNAFPYSYTISTMLVDCFLNCDKCRCFKTNHLYFKTLNHVFIQWINTVEGIHPSFQIKLFSMLCNNISPITNKISLILDTNLTRSKSKKTKRKAIEDKIVNSGKDNLQRLTPQEQITLEQNTATALGSLKSILETATGIKQEILLKLYKTTVAVALDIQAGRPNVPYHNIQCQIKLFKLLTAFLEQDDASTFIAIHPIIKILSNGAKCSNREISITCKNGLKVVEKLCQPICPYIASSKHHSAQENAQEKASDTDRTELLESECLLESAIEDKSIKNGDIIDIEADEPMDALKDGAGSAIKILSVETIVPPALPQPISNDSNADEISMNVDDDDDVEFVKLEVIISDDESNTESVVTRNFKDLQEDANDVSVRSDRDITNEIIETVNQMVSDEVKQVVDDECQMVTENHVLPEKVTCDDDEDVLNSFAGGMCDY